MRPAVSLAARVALAMSALALAALAAGVLGLLAAWSDGSARSQLGVGSLLAGIIAALAGIPLAVFLARSVSQPLAALTRRLELVASRDLATGGEVDGSPEAQAAARALAAAT